MSQPVWKCIGNIGDVNPIDHGGCLIFVDETGVYDPEMELIIPPNEDEEQRWEVRRVILEPCTYVDGILSDNRFHPDKPAWFAGTEAMRKERPQDTTYLADLCEANDLTVDEFVGMITADDNVIQRAHAWRMVYDHHGWENGDSDPLFLSRLEIGNRLRRKTVAEVLGT